jgi:hypothetical protein
MGDPNGAAEADICDLRSFLRHDLADEHISRLAAKSHRNRTEIAPKPPTARASAEAK